MSSNAWDAETKEYIDSLQRKLEEKNALIRRQAPVIEEARNAVDAYYEWADCGEPRSRLQFAIDDLSSALAAAKRGLAPAPDTEPHGLPNGPEDDWRKDR